MTTTEAYNYIQGVGYMTTKFIDYIVEWKFHNDWLYRCTYSSLSNAKKYIKELRQIDRSPQLRLCKRTVVMEVIDV